MKRARGAATKRSTGVLRGEHATLSIPVLLLLNTGVWSSSSSKKVGFTRQTREGPGRLNTFLGTLVSLLLVRVPCYLR